LASKKNDTFNAEVTGRLSELFSENDISDNAANHKSPADPQEFPFTNLKATLLSIEWEITDDILNELIAEINRLKEIYPDNKIIFSFLQLHGSVGKYIRSKKVTAHPDSINLLHSIYGALEKVAVSPGMSEAEERRILSAEVDKFKALKEQIILAQKSAARKMEIQPPEILKSLAQTHKISQQEPDAGILPAQVTTPKSRQALSMEHAVPPDIADATAMQSPDIAGPDTKPLPAPEVSPKSAQEYLVFALEEIKKLIKTEFEVLREDLKLLKKNE